MTQATGLAVLGAGAFGTALANVAARAGRSVTLWARETAVVAEINGRRTNAARRRVRPSTTASPRPPRWRRPQAPG